MERAVELREGEPSRLRRLVARARHGDERTFQRATAVCALMLPLLLLVIAFELARGAAGSFHELGFALIGSRGWDPVHGSFGALSFVGATLLTSSLALVLSVPLSLGVAIYLSELAPGWLCTPLGFVFDLLAAVPSVVYGLWAASLLTPWFRTVVEPPLAQVGLVSLLDVAPSTVLATVATLGIMMTPTISSLSRDVLRAVPLGLREAALALGATRLETLRIAVLPHVRAGLLGASLLGATRALGEGVAVAILMGNARELAPLSTASGTLASVIVNEFESARAGLHRSALVQLAFELFIVTLLLNLSARWLVSRVGQGLSRGSA